MIISKLLTASFTYYDLHSEEVVTSNFIEDINLGIYCDRLQSLTIERVTEDIKNNMPKGSKIVFDFKNIHAIQTNINKHFTELKSLGYFIAFLNISELLINELGYDSFDNKNNIKTEFTFFDKAISETSSRSGYEKFYFFENEDDFLPSGFNTSILFKDSFKNTLLNGYVESHEKQHTSSFVYLTSYIDIKRFISYEKPLFVYSIYRLAIQILKEWGENAPLPVNYSDKKGKSHIPILVCQSLNSSYIVSVLSNLLKLDVLILDKIGPINRLYNSLNKNVIEDRNYIVVSDLVCLGTEVKIVKNIIEFLGGHYLGNVALIKTETLKKRDIRKADATVAVFSIDRSNNKALKYHITTDLEEADE